MFGVGVLHVLVQSCYCCYSSKAAAEKSLLLLAAIAAATSKKDISIRIGGLSSPEKELKGCRRVITLLSAVGGLGFRV